MSTKKIIKLTESDLLRLVKKVLEEQAPGVIVGRCVEVKKKFPNLDIRDGHMFCNARTGTKIVQAECAALGITDPNVRGKFGGQKLLKGMCSGKDGKPIKK